MSNINQKFKKQNCILMSLFVICIMAMAIGFISDNSYASNVNETYDDVGVEMEVDNNSMTSHDDAGILKQQSSDGDLLGRGYGIYGKKLAKIQRAINEIAGPGDTIYVGDDCTYLEGDVPIILNKTLILTSADAYYHHRSVFDAQNNISLFIIGENARGSVLDDLKFINAVGHTGSAILIGAKDITINNCTFENNHCEEGGIISTLQDPDICDNLTISNCQFIRNTAYYSDNSAKSFAAALGIYSRNCRIINCTFESNIVIGGKDSYAGALYIGGNFTPSGSEISGCVFTNNSVIGINASSYGGAICIDYDLNITNSTFIKNNASYGGAVILQSIGKFYNCVFNRNIADASCGGAIYQDNGNLTFNIINSTFSFNEAVCGGSVYVTGDNVLIMESEFNNNSADKGGALFIKGSDVKIINNTFVNNSANYGGAIFINALNTYITNSTFISNKALLANGLGGAVYSNGTKSLINSNLFQLNKAKNGSAIYCDKSTRELSLIKNTFQDNQAQIPGLIFTVKNIFYNETENIDVVVCGGNNIYDADLTSSHAIYADCNLDEIEIDGVHPVYGAINYDKIYQDNFLYNISFLATLTHESGVVASNKTYYSNRYGQFSFNYSNLTPGDYNLTLQHVEDGYYAGIKTIHPFTVYPQVDPQISISTNQSSYNLYKLMTVTVNITNNGPNNATNIIVYNVLPEGIIYQSSDFESLYDSSKNILNIYKLADGESVIINMLTFINKTGELANNINLTVNEFDINLENNYYTAPFIINASSDLSISKTVNTTTPNYRTLIDWTVVVKNNGPDTAYNVIINDVIPHGLVISSFTGNYDDDGGFWQIDEIPAGEQVILDMYTIVNTTGVVVNNASVSSEEYDFNLSNNYDDAYIFLDPVCDLSVTTTLNSTNINYLDLIKITLTVVNNGPDNATDVYLKHVLPSSLIFIDTTNEIIRGFYELGNLTVGEKVIINITCKVNNTGNFIDYSNITGFEIDYNLTNNQFFKPVIINNASDLDVVLLVNDSNPNYRDLVNWTILITNHGLNTAHDVNVSAELPESLVYIDDSSKGHYQNGIWHVDSLDSGETKTLTITSRINKTGVIIYTVNATFQEFDFNLKNNGDLNSIKVNLSSDISIKSTVNVTDANYNGCVKLTFTIVNYGPDNAGAVRIKDILPDGLVYVNSTLEYWHNTLYVGNMVVGETKNVEMICRINKTGNIVNKVNITSNNYDFYLMNNNDTILISVNSSADLQITTFINSSKPNYNDIINLTITVKNNGPDTAHNISLKEYLPDSLKIISVSEDYDSQNGVLNIASLNPTEKTSLNIICQITETGVIVNRVSVAAQEYDHDLENNNQTTVLDIDSSCDLSVNVDINTTAANYGDYVKWTLTITNNGPDTAGDVKIENILPKSDLKVDTTYDYENSLIINVGNLDVGEIKSIDLISRVDINGTYTYTAKIICAEYDYYLENNIDSKSIFINSSADLEVTTFINSSKPLYGDLINITVSVKNKGINDASNVVVCSLLPESLIYKNDSSKGRYDHNSGKWQVGNLNCGGEAILNIECRVNSTGSIINHVNVTSDEYDCDLANNNATNSIFVDSAVDLSINTCFNSSDINYNDIVKLIIKIKNSGLDEATGVKINNTLPVALSYINSTHPYSNGVLAVGDLDKNEEITVEINCRVILTGNYTNIVNIYSKKFDFNLDNNNVEYSLNITLTSDLEVMLSVNNTNPNYKDILNWTVIVKNNGLNTAHNISITNLISDSLIPINFNGFDIVESLNAGDKIVFNMITLVNSTDFIENKFSVSADEWDYNLDNNQAVLSINTGFACDLSLEASLNVSDVNYGDLIKVSLNISNGGFNDADNVRVILASPDWLVYHASTLPIINNVINVGNLASGESTVVDIVYKVNGRNNDLYSVNVTSSIFDYNLANNNDSIMIDVNSACDLSVDIECSDVNPDFGDEVNLTLTVKNDGFDVAENVVVSCLLPDSLLFLGCNGEFQSGKCVIGNLGAGEEYTLIIKSKIVDSGEIVCLVNVTSDVFDYDLSNNYDQLVINSNNACDLSIEASVNTSVVNYGDLIMVSLDIFNNGFDDASNVLVILASPDWLVYRSSTLPISNNAINLGNLASGESTVVNIVYKVNSTSNGVYLINISSHTFDYNLTNNNNSILINVNYASDLSVDIECSDVNLDFGDEVNLTLTVKNSGFDVAENVVVSCLLSDSLVFLGCNVDFQSGKFFIGSLDAGEVYSLIIRSKIVDSGEIVCVVNVTSDVFDYDLSNNYDELVINGNNACDLSIGASVNASVVNYGDLIMVSLDISNDGFNDAGDVRVILASPDWLVYRSSTLPIINNVINLGNLASGESTIVNIVYKVNGRNNDLYSVNVTSSIFDYNLTNNNDSVLINVNPACDLSVNIGCNNSSPDFGDIVNFNVTVKNDGFDVAENVVVSCLLPDSLLFLGCNGEFQSGKCVIGNLGAGEEYTLIIKSRIVDSGEIVCVVNVTSDVFDYDLSNNCGELVINGNSACDLSIEASVNTSVVNYGDLIMVSLDIFNNGFGDAGNVRVILASPDWLVYRSSTLPIINNVINVGNLASGESTVVNIIYKVNSTISDSYSVNVTSSVFDYNLANNNDSVLINVNPACDLSVNVGCNNSNPDFGDLINFNVTVKNNGFNTAENILIKYDLSNSLIIYADDNFSIDELKAGEEVTLNILCKVNGTGTFPISFNVSSRTFDYNLANNIVEKTLVINPAVDLAVTASFNRTNLNYNDFVKITINVTNTGLNNAKDVVISNTMHDSLIYQYSTLPITNNVVELGELKINQSKTVEIVYKVNKTGSYQYFINITCSDYDINSDNNNAGISFNVGSAVDLKLTLQINNTNPNYLDTVNYCVVVKNNGLDTANNIKVSNLISDSLIFMDCDLPDHFNPHNGVWDINKLDSSDEVRLNIKFKVNKTGVIANNISVVCEDFDYDLTNNNDVKTVIINSASDLSIDIAVDNMQYNYLDLVKLTFTVKNNGLNDAGNVKINEYLPDSLIYKSSTIPYVNNAFNIGSVAAGDIVIIDMICMINSTGSIINSVNVECGEFDYNPDNNYDNLTFDISPSSDLQIDFSINNTTPNYHDLVDLTITVRNNGCDNAENITVSYDFIYSLICLNETYQSGEFKIPLLKSGNEFVLNITAKVNKTGNILLKVDVACKNHDYNPDNNMDSNMIKVNRSSDLGVVAHLNNTNLNYEDLVKVTLTITNYGVDSASDVKIINYLPDSFNSTDYTIAVQNIESGEKRIFENIFKVTKSGNYTYSVSITGSEFDENLKNNHFNQTFNVNQSSDIAVTLEINNTNPNFHDFLNYTITVRNNGLDSAHDIDVRISKSDSLIYIDNNQKNSFNTTTYIWHIGKLDVNEVSMLNIQYMINKTGSLTKTVDVTLKEFDYNESNNHNEKTVIVAPASDLKITAESNAIALNYMDIVKLTVTLTNNGPDNALNVKINEILPEGFSLINSTLKNISQLNVNQTVTFEINCRVMDIGGNVYFINISSDSYDYNLNNNYAVKSFMVNKSSDLGINVNVNNTHPNYGELVKVTVEVFNNGPDDVWNVSIVNLMDDSFILQNSPDYIKNLKVNEKRIMEFIYKVNGTGNIKNHINISSSQYDFNLANNYGDITIDVTPSSDLEIIRTANQVNPKYGDLINWTITIRNNGPDTAHNISVNDLIPDLLTPVIFTSTHELGDIWDINSLDVDEEVKFNITASVDSTGLIINKVSAYASEFDYNMENNYENAVISVSQSSDLSANLDISNSNPNYNDTITLTLTISNNGPDRAKNIKINNKIPDAFILINRTHDLNNIGNLDVGQKIVITINYRVNNVGSFTFYFNVSCDNYDYNLENNIVNKTVKINQTSDLEVTMSVNNTIPKIGDLINWGIVVKNNGLNDAHNIVVYNLLPDSLIFTQKSHTDYNPQTGMLNIAILNAGDEFSLNIITKVNKTGLITNKVNVSSVEYDYNLENNHVNKTVNVGSSVDLNISLQVNNTNPEYGDLVEWMITVINSGEINATNVKIQGFLPQALILINSTPSAGKYENGLWSISELSDIPQTLKIITKINKTGNIENNVFVSSDEFDMNESNNKATQSIVVSNVVDLKLDLKVSNSNPYIGDEIILKVEISNNGLDNASDIKVNTKIPDKLKIISHNLSEGHYSEGIWNIGNLNSGEVETLNITCIANESGEFSVEFNTTQNNIFALINVNATVDIFIEEFFNNTNPNYGDLIKWTIIVSNKGFSKANNVLIKKTLPDGLEEINTTVTKRISGPGWWFACCLENGEIQKLESICRVVKTGNITSKVNISANEYDSNLTNNYATASLNVKKSADIQIKSHINSTTPHYGEIITLTITVTNNGIDDASNVKVNYILSDAFEIIPNNHLLGASANEIWDIGFLKASESKTLNIICKIVQIGESVNVVYVNSTEYDFDSSNNLDKLEITSLPLADISIEKHISNKNPNYGDLVDLTLKISNAGPNDADNIVVENIVSDALEVIKSTDSLNNGGWFVGKLKNGEVKQLNLTCRVVSTAFPKDSLKVSGSYYDSNQANNDAGEDITVKPASDLAISITKSKNRYDIGQSIEITVDVVNNGPNVADNVKIKTDLENGLQVKTFRQSTGQFSKSGGTWQISQLNSGESAKLIIIAVANKEGSFNINAFITGDNYDYNLKNNEDSASIYVDGVGERVVNQSKSSNDINTTKDYKAFSSVLQKHKTGNPLLILGLSFMFVFVCLDERLFKKK